MAFFKCKMCGGEMSFEEGSTVAVCDYCGTRQTLPRLDNDRKVNLFDRANHFRRNNDFDKAMAIYEQILNEDIKDAEAYWSLVLCQYGIQYVEDPSTHKRIPTVNRTQFTSIYADENYKAAIANADAAQRAIYEEEAKKIEEIQKGILAISEKEEPFDVFICYKESDENGRRTHDSVLANDLYHQLTQEGFKVFYSRITLEDKLGSAYEPYIFAALHSAKVMIVIGTKPEYFNAVWVKNEWSRYLSLIKQGEKKILIPAYKDIDPYDLPEDFSHLQAQDMSKLGFMQDLIRGIRKLVDKEEPKNVSAQGNANAPSGINTQSLLKRAFLFLEDEQWDSADAYCDKVLDMDPENAQAYYGKLLAELHVAKPEALKNVEKPFYGLNNYKKVIRFADETLKNNLQETAAFIKNRNIYNSGQAKMRNARTKKDWETAAAEFQKIPGFKDADALVKKCKENAEIAQKNADYDWAVQKYAIATNINRSAEDRHYACFAATERMKTVSGWKDADNLLAKYNETLAELDKLVQEEKAEQKNADYDWAVQQYAIATDINRSAEDRNNACFAAIESMKTVSGWKDADNLLAKYNETLAELDKLVQEEKAEKERQREIKRLAAEQAKEREEKRRARVRIVTKIVIVLLILCGIGAIAAYKMVYEPPKKYSEADKLLEDKKYFEAYWIFSKLGDYQDAKEKAQIARKEMVSKTSIAAGKYHTVALRKDGTVVAVGDNSSGQCNVSDWKDIVAVAAGPESTYGIKADGTVVAVGIIEDGNIEDVSKWTDIIAISAGSQTIGLKADGTAIGTSSSTRYWHNWTKTQAVAAGDDSVYTGLQIDGNHTSHLDSDENENLIAIAARSHHEIGLKSDGTVIEVWDKGYSFNENVMKSWKDVTAITTGADFVAGIDSARKVLYAYGGTISTLHIDVYQWKNIVQICAGWDHLVGLKADGTVVASGRNEEGQCDVSGWRDILVPTP